MLRFILIISLIGYALYKLGIFRVYTHSEVRGGRPDYNPNQDNPNFNRRPAGGNVNIDSVPDEKKKKTDFKGGEYIDYEEVK